MKKQPDLVLLVPDEYNENFSISYSRKHIKYGHKTNNQNTTNNPIFTEYNETINSREPSVRNRMNIKKNFQKKVSILPIISRRGLFQDTNNLFQIKKKSYEGFKPIEDNKIRNKIKTKDFKNPLSIKYLSLKDNTNQFDKYIKSLLKKNKGKEFDIINNKRYVTNNDEFFDNNNNIKKKLIVLNKYLNKTYEKEKKQFKRYVDENKDYINDLLVDEIINELLEENNNNNRLYTVFSPNPKKSMKSPIIDNYKIPNETLSNIKQKNYKNKYSASYRKNNFKNKNEKNEENKNENKKELIIHNVFFEWVMDNVLLKIENDDIFKNYNTYNYKNSFSSKNNIRGMLNKEIRDLSKYLFRNEKNLNNSFDFLMNQVRPISDYIIKLRNDTKEIEINKKKIKSANLARTNHDKTKDINLLDNSISISNNSGDKNIKRKILNKLIKKIVNNKNENFELKYSDSNNLKRLKAYISGTKSNRITSNKYFDENEISSINNNSNSVESSGSFHKKSIYSSSSKILEENDKTEKSKNFINLRKNINNSILPKIQESTENNTDIKKFIFNIYSRNFKDFFQKYKTISAKKKGGNHTQQIIQNISNQTNKLPFIPKINISKNYNDNTLYTSNSKDFRNDQNQTNNSNHGFNYYNTDKQTKLNQRLNIQYLDQQVIFQKEKPLYKNVINPKFILNKIRNGNNYNYDSNKNIYNNYNKNSKYINTKNRFNMFFINNQEQIGNKDEYIDINDKNKKSERIYQITDKNGEKDIDKMNINDFHNIVSKHHHRDNSISNSNDERDNLNNENKIYNNNSKKSLNEINNDNSNSVKNIRNNKKYLNEIYRKINKDENDANNNMKKYDKLKLEKIKKHLDKNIFKEEDSEYDERNELINEDNSKEENIIKSIKKQKDNNNINSNVNMQKEKGKDAKYMKKLRNQDKSNKYIEEKYEEYENKSINEKYQNLDKKNYKNEKNYIDRENISKKVKDNDNKKMDENKNIIKNENKNENKNIKDNIKEENEQIIEKNNNEDEEIYKKENYEKENDYNNMNDESGENNKENKNMENNDEDNLSPSHSGVKKIKEKEEQKEIKDENIIEDNNENIIKEEKNEGQNEYEKGEEKEDNKVVEEKIKEEKGVKQDEKKEKEKIKDIKDKSKKMDNPDNKKEIREEYIEENQIPDINEEPQENKNLELENLLSSSKTKKKKGKKKKKSPQKNKDSKQTKETNDKKEQENQVNQPTEDPPKVEKNEKPVEFELIPVKKSNKNQKSQKIKNSIINILKKTTPDEDKKENEKEKDKEKKKNENENENKKSLEDYSFDEDLDSEEKKKLISYAKQIRQLNEEKGKSEEKLQQEKELKERYKLIITNYLIKQMQKELVKKKDEKIKYEKSKIKVKYNNIIDDNDSNEQKTEYKLVIKNPEPESEQPEGDENDEKESSLLLDNEDENEVGDEIKKMVNLIYDNSYLFKRKKKKEFKIRDEILEILNSTPKKDKDEKNEKKEITEDNNEEEEEESEEVVPFENNLSPIKSNINENKPANRFRRSRAKKLKSKLKIGKKKSLFEQFKSDMNNDDSEIKKKETDIKINETKNNKKEMEEKTLDEKLYSFFEQIKKLKKSAKDDVKLDNIINELIDAKTEEEKKQKSRRLYSFVESISNNRDYDRLLRPKFNFLSPIKFSTNNMSDCSD